KEPDPGARPHPAGTAVEEGSRRHDDPRLQATRDDDPVRGARRRHREGHRRMHGPPSPSGVPALPAHHRPQHPQIARSASRRRQLRDPQAPQGQGLAQAPPPLPPPLHPHIGLLDQSGRTLLRPDHRRRHPPRRLPQRRRTQDRNRSLFGATQCRAQALRLDRPSRRYPPESCQRATSVRVGTLGDFAVFPFPTGGKRLYGFAEYNYVSTKSKNPDVAAKFLDFLESTPVQQAHLGEFGTISVNKDVKYTSTEPLEVAWRKIFGGYEGTFVNGDQAFPLNVTTEYWRIINEVASDSLDPKAAAGELQKFIANAK